METTTATPEPLTRDEAHRLLLEMAAVVRTIFAVPAQQEPAAAPAAAPVAPAAPESIPAPIPAPIPVTAIPVPPLPVPETATDSAERHSLALLQEIAFLDD